jgi:uncharacterized protein YdcH (DUF465 family)
LRLKDTAWRVFERARRFDADKRVCHGEVKGMKQVKVLMKDDMIVIE